MLSISSSAVVKHKISEAECEEMNIVILVLLSLVLVGAHVIDNKKIDTASDDNGEWWRSGVVRL